LKNTVALSVGSQVFISQHIGDLETDQSFEAFRRVIADFQTLYESRPTLIAADAHPDYLSTRFARNLVSRSSRHEEALVLPRAQHDLPDQARSGPPSPPQEKRDGERRPFHPLIRADVRMLNLQ
jgi:hypothetical protein